MNIEKIEAALNLLILVVIVGVVAKYTNIDAKATELVSQHGRGAIQSDAEYELDAYELCTIVEGRSDSECDAI